MSSSARILAFAGSSRPGSFNAAALAVAAEGARQAGAEVTLINLGDFPLPLFSEELEARGGEPEAATRLKALMKAHDGYLIATPEYNGNLTPLLLNTVSWCSRKREGEKSMECFNGKVVAMVSASPGPFGGVRSLMALRGLLSYVRCLVLPGQVPVPNASQAFDEHGKAKDPRIQDALAGVGATLASTIAKLKA